MTGKQVRLRATLVLAAVLWVPTTLHADLPSDCPGSSYSPCHYNFPLAWRFCARVGQRWHAEPEGPPPYSENFYEYRSRCPYADPAALLGFSSLVQRSKLASNGAGQ
jgi:hypothetical protein